MSLFFAAAAKSDPNIGRAKLFNAEATFVDARNNAGPLVDRHLEKLDAKCEAYKAHLRAKTALENTQKQRSYDHIINANDKIIGRSLPMSEVKFDGLSSLPQPRFHPLDELTQLVREKVAAELARDAQLTELRAKGCLSHVHFRD